MVFSTTNLANVFAEENKYENFKDMTRKLVSGEDVYEYNTSGDLVKMAKKDVSRAIKKVLLEVCGLNEETVKNDKLRKRAIKAHADEVFELIESDITFRVDTGLHASEWFNEFVDERNIALGDDEVFWENTDVTLAVASVSGGHHDLTLQHIGEGKPIRIHTGHYGVKIGKDIDLILLGRVDYNTLIDKIADAYLNKIQTMAFGEVYSAAAKLPAASQFKVTGALVKATLDTLIEDVATSNNSDVIIMGTRVALKNIETLASVNWISEAAKNEVHTTGRLGVYEGTRLVEVPQRFAKNNTGAKLIPNDRLLIMPVAADKFIKFVDKGDTEIVERGNEKGDTADDVRTYEVQREFGVGVVLSQNFGDYDF